MDGLQDKAGEMFDWKQYLALARRRLWHFLIPFFVVWLVIWSFSWMFPPVYRSGTLILVEQPTVPQEYVVSNIAGNLQDRLDSITEQILSRTRLLHIIDVLHLYGSAREHMTKDDLVERMRKDIKIELVHSPENDKLTSFNIYYSSHSPTIAQQVTSELTNLFISENVEARQQQSENTTKFLESQLEEARRNLGVLEDKVRRYKDQHSGELPNQLQSNLQILSGLQSQLQSEEDALNQAKQQNVYLESLLQQYRAVQSGQRAGDEVITGLPAINQELERLRKQLAELRSRYTDRHPDVRKIKEEIARTEQLKQQIAAEPATHPDAEIRDPTTQPTEVRDSKDAALVRQLESQLKANQTEIVNREKGIAALQGRIAEYQSRLNQAPIREEQLADLTRGYDQSRANYDSLLKKRNDSELATNLELQQKSEHFRILDPPSLPIKPYFPNRRKMALIALFAGIVAGIGIAAGIEFIDERIYDEKEITSITTLHVIGDIPPIWTSNDHRKRRLETWLQCAATCVVCFAMLAGCAISYFRG